jgi:hypothetical protein
VRRASVGALDRRERDMRGVGLGAGSGSNLRPGAS